MRFGGRGLQGLSGQEIWHLRSQVSREIQDLGLEGNAVLGLEGLKGFSGSEIYPLRRCEEGGSRFKG